MRKDSFKIIDQKLHFRIPFLVINFDCRQAGVKTMEEKKNSRL